jgi:type I restriction enzyme S subunit
MWQTTTVQATLNLRDVRHLPIVVPPLYEKRAIECILGSLDDKIEGNRRLVALSDDLWQASASKKLDRIECADDEKAEGDGDVQPLTSLANFVNGRAFTKNATGSGRMVIRIAELNNGPGASTVYNDLDLAPDYLASPGELLFAWSGSLTVQRWFRPEAIINQHIFKVVPSQGTPVWLVHAHLLRLLPGYKRIASGKATTMGHIQRRDLELPVGVPGQDVLERLDSVCSPLWHRSLNAEVESLRLASLRNSLLPRLLSGELRVREAEAFVEEAV